MIKCYRAFQIINVWFSKQVNVLSAHGYTKRNWVFVTNSDFLIHKSLKPNVVDLWYFKLWNLFGWII